MKRRSFIWISGLAISAAGASIVNLFDLGFAGKYGYVKPKLLSRLCDDDTIQALGRTFLQVNPFENNRAVLEKELYGAGLHIASLAPRDVVRVQTPMEKLIYEDFDSGDTIILKGWILSRTEARQCALYFILNS